MNDRFGVLFHPSLDLSKLSDEDLHVKLTEVNRRLAYVSRSFFNQEVMAQLNNLQNVILTEQQERLERERFNILDASRPKIIETEPDLREPDPRKEQLPKVEGPKRKLHVPIIFKHWKNKPDEVPDK
jgi:hypothetical protein